MFDEVLDMFERDGRRGQPAGERRGLRGLIARMFGDGDEHEDGRRDRYESDHDDTRRSRYDDYEPDDRPGQRRRERDNDVFDFGD